jgi:hypothetical protein
MIKYSWRYFIEKRQQIKIVKKERKGGYSMKKLIVVLVLLLALEYQSYGLTIETDKVAHLGMGYIVSDVIGSLNLTGDKTLDKIVIPLASVILVATGKELLDSRQVGNRYDWKDWGYTVAGGALKLGVKFTIQF